MLNFHTVSDRWWFCNIFVIRWVILFFRLTKTNPTPFPILPVYELQKPPAGSVSEAPDERLPSTCGGGLCSTVHVEAIWVFSAALCGFPVCAGGLWGRTDNPHQSSNNTLVVPWHGLHSVHWQIPSSYWYPWFNLWWEKRGGRVWS